MINFNNKKNTRIIAGVIIVVIVLAMVVGMVSPLLYS